MSRSLRPDVRNPVLALPATQELIAFLADQPDTRERVRALLNNICTQANEKAAESFRKNKYMMFAYWKIVRVYAGHIRRAI